MSRSRLILATSSLAALFSFACAAPSSGGGTGGSSSDGRIDRERWFVFDGRDDGHGRFVFHGRDRRVPGGVQTTGTGGSSSTGGTTGTGGSSATGGSNGTGGSHTGGSTGTGGTSSTGGSTGTGGTSSTGGTTGTGGNPGTGGTVVDQGGMPLAKPGATTSTTKAYLNLGDMRLINNRWGSDALGCCGPNQTVFVNSDKTIGWTFNRGNCNEQNHGQPGLPRGGVRRRAVRKDQLAADVAGVLVDDAAADPALGAEQRQRHAG